MRNSILPMLVAIALPVAAQAQTVTQPDTLAERFLQTLKTGTVDDALKGFASASKLFAKKLEGDVTIAAQINLALAAYGPVSSWERVDSKLIGSMIRRDTYLVQHRDMVTRWRFVYVRAGSGWIGGSFVFDDQAPSWFD